MSTRRNAIKAFRFFLVTKNCARFLIEKRMERREMIKREIATFEKALEKVILYKV